MTDKSELVQRAEQVLLDMVNKAAELGSAAVDEIPVVVQDLLTWKMVESIFHTLVSFIILYFAVRLSKYLYKNADRLEELCIPIGVGNVVMYTVSIGFFSLDWLKIWLAPRVYLLEYAASLMK
jgi:hypothetical protein